MNMSIALALSAFTAATAFCSIALASSAVPNLACANAIDEKASATLASTPMMSLRSIVFPPGESYGGSQELTFGSEPLPVPLTHGARLHESHSGRRARGIYQ